MPTVRGFKERSFSQQLAVVYFLGATHQPKSFERLWVCGFVGLWLGGWGPGSSYAQLGTFESMMIFCLGLVDWWDTSLVHLEGK